MEQQELESYKKAGNISKQIKEYCRKEIKSGMNLYELAENIENKIKELGGEIGFPTNLSVDDVAAHNTPSTNDPSTAQGLLKIDIGVSVNGFLADTAITLDLSENNEHTEIIKATEDALNSAIELVKKNKKDTKLNEIGKTIHQKITSSGFSPVKNLSGHSIGQNNIHAGLTIPNFDNGNENTLGEGAFAIEPFATYGAGLVYEAGVSNIYMLIKDGSVRDPSARKILSWIKDNKQTLPFSAREIEKEFPTAKIGLKRLQEAGILKSYGQLIEKEHGAVTQMEHTLLIYDDKVEVIS